MKIMKIIMLCLSSFALAGCAVSDPIQQQHDLWAIDFKKEQELSDKNSKTQEDKLEAAFREAKKQHDDDVEYRNSIFPPAHPEIRAAWVAAHPSLSPTVARMITDGGLCVGMTPDELIASWGRPHNVNSSGGVGGTREQWCYDDSVHVGWYLYFDEGVLTSWQHQGER